MDSHFSSMGFQAEAYMSYSKFPANRQHYHLYHQQAEIVDFRYTSYSALRQMNKRDICLLLTLMASVKIASILGREVAAI